MRRTEQKILSRGFTEAYGANARGALEVASARVDGSGERAVLDDVREEMAAEALDRVARCADPVRRFARRLLRRRDPCSDCVAAPDCPRATGL